MEKGTVEAIATDHSSGPWQPKVGPETEELLRKMAIPKEDETTVLREARRMLSRCIEPRSLPGSSTGIAIGYVQSGKTASFTVVTALARDNRFGLVVVIAGTKKPLYEQSVARLRRDLRLDERPDQRAWMLVTNPTERHVQGIRSALEEWRDGGRQIVLLTVMKNYSRLNQAAQVLADLDLHDIPVLVVDDEADEASLNILVRQGRQSSTYRAILGLRGHLPVHSYLQYTATPQAPLLISLIDALSPNFAQVLTPGRAYTGGRRFFLDSTDSVRLIPEDELPTDENDLVDPPSSLLDAMRLFFLGVAAEWVGADGHQPDSGNRSMLIHPSMPVGPHNVFNRWVVTTKDQWKDLLTLPTDDEARAALVDDFRRAFDDLAKTVKDIPVFDRLVDVLPKAIKGTVVTVMHSRQPGGTPQLEWRHRFAHILIGGETLNRGFTVEGLTVTYMPRSVGVGNVDTVQQRARFYGYKASYFGYCRVFLEREAADLYKDYLRHEESVRSQLTAHGDAPLIDWKRAFLLDPDYSPTRQNVLNIEYSQDSYAEKWFKHSAPHRDPSAVAWNRSVVEAFVDGISWTEDSGDSRRTPDQRHLTARIPLRTALTDLLVPIRMADPLESVKLTGLLLQTEAFLEEHPDADAVLFRMSKGSERERSLARSGADDPDPADVVNNLHQGRNAGTGYPGDSEIKSPDSVTIQIHRVRIRGTDVAAYALAVWLPVSVASGFLVKH